MKLNPVDLTDAEWDAIEAWVEGAQEYSRDDPEPGDESPAYWDGIAAKVKMRDLTSEDAEAVLGWSEGYVEVEADDNERGPHSTAAKKLERLLYPAKNEQAKLKRRLMRP